MGSTPDTASCMSSSNGTAGGLTPVNPFYGLRYQYGMLLGVDDFETEQAYHRGKTRLHNAWLHREGVVWGLDVCIDTKHNEIKVKPGLALDPAGHELHLDATACVDVTQWYAAHKSDAGFTSTTAANGDIQFDAQVVIAFQACLTRQVPAMVDPCQGSGPNGTAYSRVNETVQLSLVPLDTTPAAKKPYWRLRLLFSLDPIPTGAGTLTQAAQDVVDARNHILTLPLEDQPAAYNAAFMKFAALDEIDVQPPQAPGGGGLLLFPAADDTAVLLAEIRGITLSSTGGTLALTAGTVDVTVRPTHVPTKVIEHLLCGPVFRDTQPKPAQTGPVVTAGSVVAAAGSTTIKFTLDSDLEANTVQAQAFSVTFLDPAVLTGWQDLGPTAAWDAPSKTITLTLATAPGTGLLRIIAKGTGPTPLAGANSIALGGTSATADGQDFVWMKGV
jgi:hypothetical protein